MLSAGMARVKKPVELRTVDDGPAPRVTVLRLGVENQPVRLIPENKDTYQAPAARLVVPAVEWADNRRSHQPGVEVLIEPEDTSVPETEEGWSRVEVRRYPVAWGWFALVALLLAWAVFWSLSHVQQAQPLIKAEQQLAGVTAEESATSDRALADLIQGMERQVKAFCDAGTLEAMLPLVRQPEVVGPLMKRYYAKTPLRALGFKRVRGFQGALVGADRDFWLFSVVLGDGSSRQIQVEQEVSGKFGVDWESAVMYQPMNWDDYARQRPPNSTMNFRVHVEEDHFFTHEYADSDRWASFRLSTPGGDETLFGYAPRGGKLENELLRLIEQNDKKPAPVILRLSLPANTKSHRGVIIEKVASPRWIYVDPPQTES